MAKKLTKEHFLKRAKDKHGERYNYDAVEYLGATTKVKIWCDVHGFFEQRPTDHYVSGCSKCGDAATRLKNKLSFDDRVKKIDEISNGNLVLLECNGNRETAKAFCKTSQTEFATTYRYLTECEGCCPTCNKLPNMNKEQGYIYLTVSENYLKVGVSRRTPEQRMWEVCNSGGEHLIPQDTFYADWQNCLGAEKILLSFIRDELELESPDNKFGGSTETFKMTEQALNAVAMKFIQMKTMYKTMKVEKVVKTSGTTYGAKLKETLKKKNGVPVGVSFNQGSWVFHLKSRTRKECPTLGRFENKEDACTLADHFWETHKLLDMVSNQIFYTKEGQPKYISRLDNKEGVRFRVSFADKITRWHVGTFDTLEEAKYNLRLKQMEVGFDRGIANTFL